MITLMITIRLQYGYLNKMSEGIELKKKIFLV